MNESTERLEVVLGAMATGGPRDLRRYVAQPGPDFEIATPTEVDELIEQLLASDPNAVARLRFSNLLRGWDNAKDPSWGGATRRNSVERRKQIHARLKSGEELAARIDQAIPFYRLEEPLIIAAEHSEWYVPKPEVRDYYWSRYVAYLREKKEWSGESIQNLDNHTQAVVECLANPEATQAYASRGLVMGYVQSGKTANFTGVIARATDAGYRLIIVLAGTWNILRNQTQRRFDKELLGKELLANDDTYVTNPPPDWSEFLEHGEDPVALGHYGWQRLTRPDIDFSRLKAAIDNLEFERINKAAPIFDSSNIHSLPVKLLVVKKHSGILQNLVKDLKLISTRLADLPALIIDDESDQAGLNTVDPKKKKPGASERSKTNARIVDLLGLFPRGQYVGYTATPYANAMVNPDDPEDLFPKDFILPLDRPRGYMGVSDFFDPNTEYADLKQDDFSLPEVAHIRRVETSLGEDDADMCAALRSYVLSGGLKLFRLQASPSRYKAQHMRHHTMLVHTSSRRGDMAEVAGRLKALWDRCAFNSPAGLSELERLWRDDFAKVAAASPGELMPESLSQLIPFLGDAIKRIERGPRVFLVVNSDSTEAPDFGAAPVWKIILGGNKLSRGYTVEGLTVSYYRRVAGTADTLMQMGRWFGYRPGYQDLVRVFLGVKEGRKGATDLVSQFKEVCRMEERFRDEIRRYVRRPGVPRITPAQIPPLISATGSLPPTSRNKMFNAVIKDKNFRATHSMLTLIPAKSSAMTSNLKLMQQTLASATDLKRLVAGGVSNVGGKVSASLVAGFLETDELVSFLTDYRWLETEYKYPARPADAQHQIEFLSSQPHGIKGWVVVAPQRKESFGDPIEVEKLGELTVKERQRSEGRGFQVFGEPMHRAIADYLAGISTGKLTLVSGDEATESLRRPHHGVLLLYPVRPTKDEIASVGFELFFPENNLPFDVNFAVRRLAERDKVTVGESAT
jgi:hypothetical protein